MKFKALCNAERPNEYNGKKGQVKEVILTFVDMTEDGESIRQNVDFVLSDELKIQWAGKAKGKFFVLELNSLETFGGSLRGQGKFTLIGK
jgi:hypothetical protein